MTLDATGAGQVLITPTGGDWVLVNMGVSVSSSTLQPTAKLFKNFPAQVNFIEGSYTGANDSSNTRIVLRQGETLFCVWAGGDAGARATLVCQVVQYPPGQAPLEQ
ncbi:hypothetical protein [Fodinicola feengrottensis]|uniref:hypothetical protein n=1 Tax=Fodinicola feengrottensis TaxID=435914 RepID=UPI0013D0A2DF|nr:hypothetical protein [Fodinicola feengrottensis]